MSSWKPGDPERRKEGRMDSETQKEIVLAAAGAAKVVVDAAAIAAREIKDAASQANGKKIFGFTIQELSMMGLMLSSLLFFYWRTDDTLRRLVKLGEYTTTFMQNSDNYNSAKTGRQFAQGMPVSLLNKGDT